MELHYDNSLFFNSNNVYFLDHILVHDINMNHYLKHGSTSSTKYGSWLTQNI